MIDLNPIAVIVVFIALLAALIYYLQSKEQVIETAQVKSEPNIVKVKDYESQFDAEKKEEPPAKAEEAAVVDDVAELEGVGPKYQELLREAGYGSLASIAESKPMELYETLLKTNEEKDITKRPPTLQNVEDWVKAAGSRSA